MFKNVYIAGNSTTEELVAIFFVLVWYVSLVGGSAAREAPREHNETCHKTTVVFDL